MEEISEIQVKNIKGFGDASIPIKVSILPNKVNLLVAPNGWGKSSLTAAFESLRSNKIDVSKENKYKQDETLDSELKLVYNGTSYTANSRKNEINNLFTCKVIHCDLYPKAVSQNMGAFSSSRGYLGIKDIEICNIPKRVELTYKYMTEKATFGTNGKILNNLTAYLLDKNTLSLFCNKEITSFISKMDGKKVSDLVCKIKDNLNSMLGTQNKIKGTVNTSLFSDINTNNAYKNLKRIFCDGKSDIDAFTNIFQIIRFYNQNKTNINAYFKYNDYITYKTELDKNISDLNSTWKEIKTREKDGKLIVEFPYADVISNGQRDILTFIVRLQVFKAGLRPKKSFFLLIDEVFDYLDDANVLAAQYYLTHLINYAKEIGTTLIVGIFTHLDPKYFRSYTFGKKTLKVSYLKDVTAQASNEMKTFIAFRQELNHKDEGDEKKLWNDLSKYCFHYHTDLPKFKEKLTDINKTRSKNKVKESWGEGTNLLDYLLTELNKYLSDKTSYDPYAVSLAIRIATEKKVYDSLDNDCDKNEFVNIRDKGTKDKMEFAEEKGKMIPDAYYILSLIHGESDHIEYDENTKEFKEKPVVYKLNNIVVKHMVAELFDYKEGIDVPKSKLH
ncbi:MAG: ATP-binding protein [Bacteroidales bacterium]|nr:ATP-binding protein [Bacteroidales bacterium]